MVMVEGLTNRFKEIAFSLSVVAAGTHNFIFTEYSAI